MTELATRPAPQVIVDADALTDAALIPRGPQRLLVLRPQQTFSNAVTQVSQLCPDMSPDQVRAVVRAYLPDALDLDMLESQLHTDHPPVSFARESCKKSLCRRILAHMAVTSLVTLPVLGYVVLHPEPEQPYDAPVFQQFAEKGRMQCFALDPAHARCTDVDGLVMYSTVVTGPDYTQFVFAYGAQKIMMRVFPTVARAQAWAREPATSVLYPNMQARGRYVFFGTDKKRVDEYAKLMDDAGVGGRGHGKQPMKADEETVNGVPVRLVALAFGALNLPDEKHKDKTTPAQANAAMTVLGTKPSKKQKKQVPVPTQVEAAVEPAPGKAGHKSPEKVLETVLPQLEPPSLPVKPAPAAEPSTEPQDTAVGNGNGKGQEQAPGQSDTPAQGPNAEPTPAPTATDSTTSGDTSSALTGTTALVPAAS